MSSFLFSIACVAIAGTIVGCARRENKDDDQQLLLLKEKCEAAGGVLVQTYVVGDRSYPQQPPVCVPFILVKLR